MSLKTIFINDGFLLLLLGLLLFGTGVYKFAHNQGAIELWVGPVAMVIGVRRMVKYIKQHRSSRTK